MKTWRDVKWKYEGEGCVWTYVKGEEEFLVCYVPVSVTQDEIGRAIAHAWNVDLAQTEWTRELFGDASAP